MKMTIRQFIALSTLLLMALVFSEAVSKEDDARGPILLLSIDGAIGPSTDDYLQRAIEHAQQQGAQLIILQMDTPGGLDTSMRRMIKNIIASSVPVVAYVSPSGARAASAGTYILYASHIAAMAPGTNLGAATPVQIGGVSPGRPGEKDGEKDTPGGEEAAPLNEQALRNKAVNDAVAYIRGLAQMRGRNQQWAEKAVRQAVSIPAQEALDLNVIDLVAQDMNDLLVQLNGRIVLFQGQKITLNTTGATLQPHEPDWRNRLLDVITNPNVAYILMLIGIYGLIFEFSNPGSILPGTVGGICLLLALYAFQLLPISYAGMALILLGIALMIGEAYQPSFGVLGIGGVVAFVIGSVILIDTDVPGYGIDLSVIATFALTSALMFIIVIGMAMRARRKPVVSGMDELIGKIAIVEENFDYRGHVRVHSERWNAESLQPLLKNQRVRVTEINGLVLKVEPLPEPTEEKQS